MMHCYVVREDGYALIDETGVVVGRVIDLDRQILGSKSKLCREPTRWFTWHVHKIRRKKVSA